MEKFEMRIPEFEAGAMDPGGPRGRTAGRARGAIVVLAMGLSLFPAAGAGLKPGETAGSSAAHWAFQPVHRPEVPQVAGAGNPIDALLLAPPSGQPSAPLAPAADRRTLLRRVTYDLTGLPPAPDDVDAFVADGSPEAWSKVVEHLLASPGYGEHWGRHWLDVVRYADTAGENSDHPLPHAWRYRNWVIGAFNRDLPYDEFIREQIAGDLLAAGEPPDVYADHVIATGYLAMARRFGHDIDKDMHLTLEDTIDTLGKSVLGLTLGCARCHDHKNDPVTSRDYYGLYGIFESTRFAFPGCEPKQQPRDLVPLWSADEIKARRQPWDQQMATLDARVKKLTEAQTGVVQAMRQRATNTAAVLARGEIPDGGRQEFTTNANGLTVPVKTGEMLQLTISPKANYGADTTVIEFKVEAEEAASRRQWNLAGDVTPDFLAGNPHADDQGHAAVWCFLDPRKGLQLLAETVKDLDGRKGLHVWRNGENPSAFVNATDQPIKAWTTLPARTFFVHPAADGPVAVAWLSPLSGRVKVTGRVVDGHPGGGDGVGWTLEHVAADVGADMTRLAALAAELRAPMQERTELKSREPRVPVAYAVAEGAARNTRLQKRGDPEQLGAEVPRKFLDLLGGQVVSTTNHSGRLELAQWLTSPTNPLAARVMINRIWQGHFGRGLVPSPNDFGRQGQPPTNPALLDWLASEFVRTGWSVKAMHRLILHSRAYQQNSTRIDGSAAKSEFAPFPRRRLSAEELRDTLLTVSGELDRTPGGAHPFPPEDKWSFTQHGPFAADYETTKRSVYVMQKRNRRIPFFALFDGPDPNASTAKRDNTTVPTQALYFMNDPFVHARAEKLAARVVEGQKDDRARLDGLCRLLFGRAATDDERADWQAFRDEYGRACTNENPERQTHLTWAAFTRVLLGSNELLYVD